MMKVPAFVRLLPLLLLAFLLSSCAHTQPQPKPKQIGTVIRTYDELYEHLHGSINSWPETSHYLGTSRDGFHIVRTSYPPWWMFQPAKTIAIRQEVLPQWHPRPYPLPRTRWLPVPWILFCPSHPVPPSVQRKWEQEQEKRRQNIRTIPWRALTPPWPVLQAPLVRSKYPARPARVPVKVMSDSDIDGLLGLPSLPQDPASQMREPDDKDLRQRDALLRADDNPLWRLFRRRSPTLYCHFKWQPVRSNHPESSIGWRKSGDTLHTHPGHDEHQETFAAGMSASGTAPGAPAQEKYCCHSWLQTNVS